MNDFQSIYFYLQHSTARYIQNDYQGPQNCSQGLEIGLLFFFQVFLSIPQKLFFWFEHSMKNQKSKMATREPNLADRDWCNI